MTNRQKAIARHRFMFVDGELVARIGYKRGRTRVRSGDPAERGYAFAPCWSETALVAEDDRGASAQFSCGFLKICALFLEIPRHRVQRCSQLYPGVFQVTQGFLAGTLQPSCFASLGRVFHRGVCSFSQCFCVCRRHEGKREKEHGAKLGRGIFDFLAPSIPFGHARTNRIMHQRIVPERCMVAA